MGALGTSESNNDRCQRSVDGEPQAQILLDSSLIKYYIYIILLNRNKTSDAKIRRSVLRARIVVGRELRTGAGAWCVQSTCEQRARRRARLALSHGPTKSWLRTEVYAHAADTSATILAQTYAENVHLSEVKRQRLITHLKLMHEIANNACSLRGSMRRHST